MRKYMAAVLAASVLTLAGCSAGLQSESTAEPTEEPLPAKCLTATAGAISDLQADVAATIPGVEFSGHGVTKSESGDEFWFIALRYEENDILYTGTWGTLQDPTANEHIAYVAVDEIAALSGTYKQPVDFQGVTTSAVGADDCIPG